MKKIVRGGGGVVTIFSPPLTWKSPLTFYCSSHFLFLRTPKGRDPRVAGCFAGLPEAPGAARRVLPPPLAGRAGRASPPTGWTSWRCAPAIVAAPRLATWGLGLLLPHEAPVEQHLAARRQYTWHGGPTVTVGTPRNTNRPPTMLPASGAPPTSPTGTWANLAVAIPKCSPPPGPLAVMPLPPSSHALLGPHWGTPHAGLFRGTQQGTSTWVPACCGRDPRHDWGEQQGPEGLTQCHQIAAELSQLSPG